MEGKPASLVVITEKNMWCMTCKEFVGTEYQLQHVYPEKYPDAKECEKCSPDHFFYYHHCPKCHLPRIIAKTLYESFLPLNDGDDVDYCESCDRIKKLRKNEKYDDAWLCDECYEKPGWVDDE